ncbi:MAG: hypothetical protein PHU78_10510, partial [Heliobacteriaceae bacterium]|nr:hypothetical protein [Heliobacteriaceae bacterium]
KSPSLFRKKGVFVLISVKPWRYTEKYASIIPELPFGGWSLSREGGDACDYMDRTFWFLSGNRGGYLFMSKT